MMDSFLLRAKKIFQYKIIGDEDNNFIRIKKLDEIECDVYNSAIITNGHGKIFYKQNFEGSFDETNLFLAEY